MENNIAKYALRVNGEKLSAEVAEITAALGPILKKHGHTNFNSHITIKLSMLAVEESNEEQSMVSEIRVEAGSRVIKEISNICNNAEHSCTEFAMKSILSHPQFTADAESTDNRLGLFETTPTKEHQKRAPVLLFGKRGEA